MAFNFGNTGNSALENFSIFSTLANATAIVSNPSYINPLVAAAAITTSRRREKTPEPPPAPKLSIQLQHQQQSRKMKPNQGGGAPMDIENDECEITTQRAQMVGAITTQPMTTPTALIKPTNNSNNNNIPNILNKDINETEKLNSTTAAAAASAMTDPNIFLNGFPTSYMFFPAASSTTAAANAATMLMDPTTTAAMMAAAMQQMQQTYPGYAALAAADGSGGNAVPQLDGATGTVAAGGGGGTLKEIIKTKHCILFPPNPDAPPPTIRERPPGCRTVFVGGLPENITEEIIREIFESCGEITTLRMSKKNFCHIRYRTENSIDHAIYLSGYRLRIADASDPMNYGRLHVDYAQARDDQYDYECKQRQQLREQRHRERMALDRSESPPPIPHYTDHEASLVSEHLRNNETFLKSVQTITIWLERGDCTKRNANAFYSMIQSTHAHVRRLYADKQLLEQDLRKARESYRKQMLTMSTQFTQIEKVFSAASHKKVWDHFTKAQRKNIDQWKKLASELRSVQIEDDEMEMSDDDRDSRSSSTKKARYDSDSLKDENDSLRCQIDAMRNEMFLNRSELRQDSDFREKQIKVLQETIRNMQTQLLQTKMREQKDANQIEQLERELKEARVRALLLQTQIKEARLQKQQQHNKQEIRTNMNASNVCIANDVEQEAEAEVESVTNSLMENLPQEEQLKTKEPIEAETENNSASTKLVVLQEAKENVYFAELQKNTLKNEETTFNNNNNNTKNTLITNDNNQVFGNNANADDAIDEDDDVHFVSIKQREVQRHDVVKLNGGLLLNQNSNDKDNKIDVVCLVEDEEEQQQQRKNVVVQIKKTTQKENVLNKTLADKVVENCEEKSNKENLNDIAAEKLDVYKITNERQTTGFKSLEHFEARIIALVAAYLVVQPFGACSSSICYYLSSFLKTNELNVKSLEEILKKYENLFKTVENEVTIADDDDVDVTTTTNNTSIKNYHQRKINELDLKWKFCGFIEETNNKAKTSHNSKE